MAVVESTGVINVFSYMTVVDVTSFLVACGKSFTSWLEWDPTRRIWALPSLDSILEKSMRSTGYAKLNRPMA